MQLKSIAFVYKHIVQNIGLRYEQFHPNKVVNAYKRMLFHLNYGYVYLCLVMILNQDGKLLHTMMLRL